MSIVEFVLRAIVWLLVAALVVFLGTWALDIAGINLPERVLQILYAIVIVLVLLWLYTTAKKQPFGVNLP